MADFLYAIASVGFLFWIARNAFFWGDLVQRNGFSFKRIKNFLLHSPSGRHVLFSPLSLLKWFAIFFYPVIIFYENAATYYHLFICVIYSIEIFIVIKENIDRNFFTTRIVTIKSFFIIAITITLGIVLFFYPPLDKFLWLVLIDRFIVYAVLLSVMIFAIPEELFWEFRSFKAATKLEKHKKLIRILLIGGPETQVMKALLSQNLSRKYVTLTTKGKPEKKQIIHSIMNYSFQSRIVFLTDIAISQEEDLQEITTLLKPHYIVLDTSYLTLAYADPEAIQNSILSLLEKMAKKRMVLIRYDEKNPGSQLRRKDVRYYSDSNEQNSPVDFSVEEIEIKKRSTSFTIRSNTASLPVESKLLTETAARYVTPVMALLTLMGIPQNEISNTLRSADHPPGFLSYADKKGVVLVNNTGETDALKLSSFHSYLKLYNRTKILVWDPWVSEERKVTKRYNDTFAAIDYIFITGDSAGKAIISKIRSSNSECSVTHANPKKIVDYLLTLVNKGDVIVFYGAGAEDVYRGFIRS
jgi:hypothetical protein